MGSTSPKRGVGYVRMVTAMADRYTTDAEWAARMQRIRARVRRVRVVLAEEDWEASHGEIDWEAWYRLT